MKNLSSLIKLFFANGVGVLQLKKGLYGSILLEASMARKRAGGTLEL